MNRKFILGNLCFAEMDYQENEQEALERILSDAGVEPIMLSFAFLRKITNDFSQEIGRGGFGVVYMVCILSGYPCRS